jgi:amidase
MGGDGGGSIRIPAACCGLFGLKPTRGLVSMAPVLELWHALGTIGPLTRTVGDSALLYDVLCPGARGTGFVAATGAEPGRLRIAVSTKSAQVGVRVDPEQAIALHATADTLRGLGHDVDSADPDYPDLFAALTPQVYGGIRDEAQAVERPDLLERRTKQALMIARAFPRPVVERAKRRGERIAARVNRFFDAYDVLLTPTIAPLPRAIGALDGLSNIRAGLRSIPYIAYTAVWNVTGNPAASIPAGTAARGTPLAVQLVAPPQGELTIMALAAQLERTRPWADRRPADPLPGAPTPQ